MEREEKGFLDITGSCAVGALQQKSYSPRVELCGVFSSGGISQDFDLLLDMFTGFWTGFPLKPWNWSKSRPEFGVRGGSHTVVCPWDHIFYLFLT
mmetsp:Transcript_14049/g.25103  ORF Transcript_14049/g.25103 Transcript_14049/m.25103 type:complete len:95 (-) Transcript_14049:595-879(-)